MRLTTYHNYWNFWFSLEKVSSLLTLYDNPSKLMIGIIDNNGNEYYLSMKAISASTDRDLYIRECIAFGKEPVNGNNWDTLKNTMKINTYTKEGKISFVESLNAKYLNTDIGKMNEALR